MHKKPHAAVRLLRNLSIIEEEVFAVTRDSRLSRDPRKRTWDQFVSYVFIHASKINLIRHKMRLHSAPALATPRIAKIPGLS
jgi:hypothetical protein